MACMNTKGCLCEACRIEDLKRHLEEARSQVANLTRERDEARETLRRIGLLCGLKPGAPEPTAEQVEDLVAQMRADNAQEEAPLPFCEHPGCEWLNPLCAKHREEIIEALGDAERKV